MDKHSLDYSEMMRRKAKKEIAEERLRVKAELTALEMEQKRAEMKLILRRMQWDQEQQEKAIEARRRAELRRAEQKQRVQDAVQSYDDAVQAQELMDKLTRG